MEHTHSIVTLSWSPDGNTIASGSRDKTVRLWDVKTGKLLQTFYGHKDRVTSISWSHDGTIIASGSHDKTVQLWDVKTGRFLKKLEHNGPVESVRWSLDGNRVISKSLYKYNPVDESEPWKPMLLTWDTTLLVAIQKEINSLSQEQLALFNHLEQADCAVITSKQNSIFTHFPPHLKKILAPKIGEVKRTSFFRHPLAIAGCLGLGIGIFLSVYYKYFAQKYINNTIH